MATEDESALTPPTVRDEHAEVWALVLLAQTGDTDAFGQLYKQYADVILKFLRYRMEDWHLAEDLTSEVFIRAQENIRSVTYQNRDLKPWLVTIARNVMLDNVRRFKNRSTTPLAEMPLKPGHVIDPAAAALTSLRNAALRQALSHLTPDQQQCIELRFFRDLPIADTAKKMGKTPKAITVLQVRALRSLRPHLSTELFL